MTAARATSGTRPAACSAPRRPARRGHPRGHAGGSRRIHRPHQVQRGQRLTRTGIVALAYLDDVEGMVRTATMISSLTHSDPRVRRGIILWCSGIRTAVLEGTFDGVREGIGLLPEDRQEIWHARLDEAEANPPDHWGRKGYVVTALQAAWSAITGTPVPELAPDHDSFPARHFQLASEAAVRAGDDTDTVAAIAGALLGARWGVSVIPLAWQQAGNGWPTMTGPDLVRLAVLTARKGVDDGDTNTQRHHRRARGHLHTA
ncbi:ADP-ribosylglycohydrolase family protein [Streptomyces sp. NPDC002285]